jgi:hypothetical protein
MLELLQERANGDDICGMALDESPAERLRVANAAPIGEVPGWGQRGVFRLVIDGVPNLVEHDDDDNFSVYAEDPDKPFVSETGYRSLSPFEVALGCSVREQAEAFIREEMAATTDYKNGKRKPRKGAMPKPAQVYRMPTLGEGIEPIEVSADEASAAIAPQPSIPPATSLDGLDVDAFAKAKSTRRIWPPGHVVKMTNPVYPGRMLTVGSCECGVVFSFPWGCYREMDAAVEAHWQQFDPPPVAVDLPPAAAPIEISEFDALKAFSDFCYPKRREIVPAIADDYIARGLALQIGGLDDWTLTVAGTARLRLLEDQRRASAPQRPAPAADDLEIPAFLRRYKPAQGELDLAVRDRAPPDVVDGVLQTRLPLTDDELGMQAALRAIDAEETVDGEMIRHLVGTGFAHVTTSRVLVTEEGRAFLAQLVPPAPARLEAVA